MTKPLATVLALALSAGVPLAARASEIAPGTVELVGGSAIGFDKTTSTGSDSAKVETTSFALDLRGLYYVTPNLGIGPLLGYQHVTAESASGRTVSTLVVVGPAIGLDLPIDDRLSFFALAAGGRAMGAVELSGPGGFDATIDMSGWSASAGAGLKVFLGRSVSFDLGVGYHWVRVEGEDDLVHQTHSSTDKGFGVNAGISVYLPTR